MNLASLGAIRIGHAFRQAVHHVPGGNACVLQAKDIRPFGALCLPTESPLQVELPSLRPLLPNDILIAARGRFAAAVFELPPGATWIASASLLVLSLKTTAVLPQYVAYVLNSPEGQRLFRAHAEKTTMPYIKASNLGQMNIQVPSLEQQKAVVAFGDSVGRFAALAQRKQELYQAILNHQLQS